MLKEILLALLLKHAPPGHTKYSVEMAPECAWAQDQTCEGAVWSTFYGGWVRHESADSGAERLRLIASAVVDSATELLCLRDDGTKVDGCKPEPGAMLAGGKKPRWRLTELTMVEAAVLIMESGLREDVEVGRGRARKHPKDPPTDDAGGEGRGPANEACLAQIHPVIAFRYADAVPEELRKRAARDERGAREELAQLLLGTSPEALRRCVRTSMRMLIAARAYCDWRYEQNLKELKNYNKALKAADQSWAFATFSLYGTGESCGAYNRGKTPLRAELYKKLAEEAKEAWRATRARHAPAPPARPPSLPSPSRSSSTP
jgi:hypothetical protein